MLVSTANPVASGSYNELRLVDSVTISLSICIKFSFPLLRSCPVHAPSPMLALPPHSLRFSSFFSGSVTKQSNSDVEWQVELPVNSTHLRLTLVQISQ